MNHVIVPLDKIAVCILRIYRAPGLLGICREWMFIFGELGSTDHYLQGFGEQAHCFSDLGRSAKK